MILEQKQTLEKQLWNIANDLRGNMDAFEFKDYILGLIFYKYLSERQLAYANDLLQTEEVKDYPLVTDKGDIEAIRVESLEYLGYFLEPSELFSAVVAKGQLASEEYDTVVIADLKKIFNNIIASANQCNSAEDFNNLFEDLDLDSTKLGRDVNARNDLVVRIMANLDRIDFRLSESDSDVLGDAYEYLISQFASSAGKKAGEFYTPQQVSKVLAKIVTLGRDRIRNAYDPTCGSGSLLLRIEKELRTKTSDGEDSLIELYGQELNRTTYNLARMNMIMHQVHFERFDIRQEDTLEKPQHRDLQFETVVANPPFSARWAGDSNPLHNDDDRFSMFGKLAPKSKADFAFVQHMLYQLADNGTMAVVLPHGVLFRGAAEGTIRRYIIEELNYLDAIIGLPANLFYGTGIPTCILVLKKCRRDDDSILFIDASREFEKVGNQNTITDEQVERIVSTFKKRETIEKYSYLAQLDEIRENEFNLNIPRYVDTFEKEESIDLEQVAKVLKQLETQIQKTDKTIEKYCKELGIAPPF
ncbi:MAG: type I restriction-modification system subunit M [Gammaproteobacteria bacterium]|nr:type I restriction-modification system subunit M [Gammaproteobacteria bacterium]MDE0252590.1 type I restriction-modification system subunit M [Gammaproteobacteria bacterium]MDE0403552.1 type I restriction-modification system subunit M [Gammaproteobacteria bacterium]